MAFDDPIYKTLAGTMLMVESSSVKVLANDGDVDGGTLTASLVANPANGTLMSFGSDGTFMYMPNGGFVGVDSFTYKANDGGLDSNVATVSIAVGGDFGARTNLDDVPLDAALHTGAVTLSQPLSQGLSLNYRSDTYPRPVVVVETSLLSTSSVPNSIDAQLTFGGITGSTVSFNTSGLSSGDPLRFVLQVDAASLATGYYSYTVTLTANYSSAAHLVLSFCLRSSSSLR